MSCSSHARQQPTQATATLRKAQAFCCAALRKAQAFCRATLRNPFAFCGATPRKSCFVWAAEGVLIGQPKGFFGVAAFAFSLCHPCVILCMFVVPPLGKSYVFFCVSPGVSYACCRAAIGESCAFLLCHSCCATPRKEPLACCCATLRESVALCCAARIT